MAVCRVVKKLLLSSDMRIGGRRKDLRSRGQPACEGWGRGLTCIGSGGDLVEALELMPGAPRQEGTPHHQQNVPCTQKRPGRGRRISTNENLKGSGTPVARG